MEINACSVLMDALSVMALILNIVQLVIPSIFYSRAVVKIVIQLAANVQPVIKTVVSIVLLVLCSPIHNPVCHVIYSVKRAKSTQAIAWNVQII